MYVALLSRSDDAISHYRMDPVQGLLLGIVQGLTEFLTVSSTGHLILARAFFGWSDDYGLAIDAVLQLATALAVLVYFRKDLLALVLGCVRKERQSLILGGALAAGTVPAIILGLLLENTMETVFRSATLVAGTLALGSLVFVAAEKWATQNSRITLSKGIAVGFFQALALIPGMSRSGMTISGGLFLGLTREEATRFGFLLSLPIIFGSGMKKLLELWGAGLLSVEGGSLTIAALAAFFSGLGAIYFMIRFVRTHTLIPFVWYRLALAVLVLVLL